MLFAHHVAVEILGREFSPHTAIEHVCTFGAVGFLLATSAYGCWALLQKARESGRRRESV